MLLSFQNSMDRDTDRDLRSEIQAYLAISQQRHRILPRAVLVGIGAGCAALLFRAALTGADALRGYIITLSQSAGWLAWLPVVLGAGGAAAAVALTRSVAPEAAGSGIPHVEAVLNRFRTMRWKSLLLVKFIGGVLAIGSGLALGREGPTVQIGGTVGEAIGRGLKSRDWERLTYISAGAGAGLAAIFNAPLSGLVFVLEEVRRDFQPIVFSATFVAAVVADVIARLGAGPFPVFKAPTYPSPPITALPLFVVLGAIAGLLGVVFNRGLLTALTWVERVPPRWIVPLAALVGALIGLIGYHSQILIGSGHALSEAALNGRLALELILPLLLVRFILTIISYATGAPGGIFAPMLVLGALMGLFIGQISHNLWPAVVPIPATFAVVGMAAFFTASVRAPLTGITLIVEMTNNYQQVLPLLASCFVSYAVAEALRELPIYEALLERDLGRHGSVSLMKRPTLFEFIVQPGSPFAGREIRSLGLPPGCVLIRCSDGRREWVPKATTRLQPYMRVTAIIAPEAKQAIEMLREGCRATEKVTDKETDQ